MLNKLKIFLESTILIFLFTVPVSASVDYENQDTGREYAIQLFNSGEYIKATPIFEKLVTENPEDEMLNYYYGACLAEQDIFTDKTNQYLLKAISGNTPDKIFYYVGKYFQSRELWNSALKYYNRFNNFGTNEEKVAVEIEKLIQYCNDQTNPRTIDSTSVTATNFDTIANNSADILLTGAKIDIINEPEEATETGEIEKFEPIYFQVSSDIKYLKPGHFKNSEALIYYNEGILAETQLGKIVTESDSLRKLYSHTTVNRNSISENILALEQETYLLKNKANLTFNKARELEQAYWDNAGAIEIETFLQEIVDLKTELDRNQEKTEEPENILANIGPEILIPENPLEIRNPAKKETDKIRFKIQIGAYSRSLPDYVDRLYKKLSLIRVIDNYTDDRGVTVYTTGNLTNFEDAVRMQAQVRQEGVKDAFVVAYKNGKRIKLSEAKEILNIK